MLLERFAPLASTAEKKSKYQVRQLIQNSANTYVLLDLRQAPSRLCLGQKFHE